MGTATGFNRQDTLCGKCTVFYEELLVLSSEDIIGNRGWERVRLSIWNGTQL